MKIKLLLISMLSAGCLFSQSWESLNTGLPSNIKVHSMVLTPQSNYQVGYAVGGDNYTSGIVIKTTDGGNTWSAMNTIASEELYSVCFPATDTGYTCSMEGKVYKTTNGGTTWQLIYTAPSGQSFSIAFRDVNRGVLGTPTSIAYTLNGGQSWQSGAGSSNTNSQDITWCEEGTYFAAGYNYANLTTNNGLNWTQLVNYASELLLGTGSYDARYLATCGDYGYIHISKDWGVNWSDVKIGDNLFHDVAYWDTNYIYVVGTPGLVYKSSDGGESFTSDGNLGSGAVFCVFITPDFTIYATGSQGKIWKKKENYPYAIIQVSTDSLLFDTINTGTSQIKSFTVTNTGNQNLVVSGIITSLPEYSANPSSFTLGPGANQTVDVTFAPIMEGSFPGILTVYHNAPGQDSVTIDLIGNAIFPVGLSGEKTSRDFIKCYPNPFSEVVYIDLISKKEQSAQFQILDATGNLIHSTFRDVPPGLRHFTSAEIWPSSGNLAQGVYFLRVITEKSAEVIRIVKIRN